MKKIGIIIPAYNAEKYISTCLESVLNQTIKDAQVIIVDDCSIDSTLSIIQSFKPRFEKCGFEYNIISLKKNCGQAACFNYAFKLLSSELFMWLDSDDFLYPNCFEQKIKFMDSRSDIDLCICRGDLYNWPNLKDKVQELFVKSVNCDYFANVLLREDVLWVPGSVCVRTKFLFSRLKNKTIYASREGQNIQLLLPILYRSNYKFMDNVLYGVVAHDDSHSRQKRNSRQFILREKGLIAIYKNTIKRLDTTRKEKRKYTDMAIRDIYLSIFNVCVSKKMVFKVLRYYFYLRKTDKHNFIQRVKGRRF